MAEEMACTTPRHFCLLHEDGDRRTLAVARFIRQGLRQGERVLFAHDGSAPSGELEALERLGADPGAFLSSGQLVVAPARELYLEDGDLDPDRMIRRLRREVSRARADGFTDLRLVGGTEWRHRADVRDALLEFERRGSEDLEELAWTGLCQYRVDRAGPGMVEALVESHDRTFTSPDRIPRVREVAGGERGDSVRRVDAIVDLDRNRVEEPGPERESGPTTPARPAVERELRRAIERREFVLRYQPIVDLESREVVGAEALVRWQHPERGLLAPEEFLEAAERTGLVIDIGRLVLDGAVSSLRRWEEQRVPFDPFTLSLNLSALQYREPELVERVAASLRRRHIDPEYLQFEIRGDVAARRPETLEELQQVGIRIAVDDIATSHSLERLDALGADSFKIDRGVVTGIGGGSREEALVESILGLAARKDLPVVAEGIEEERQRRILRRLGCRLGQGYLFARPLPEERFEELLGARVIGGTGEDDTEWVGDG